MADLFDGLAERGLVLRPGMVVLRGAFDSDAVLAALAPVLVAAPLRRMATRTGQQIGVEMTNCGALGWVSDRHGYRYAGSDPLTGRPWPELPELLGSLATRLAAAGGFGGFVPDCCLVNRYHPGIGLSLHQDRDERGFDAPIVSLSVGIEASFIFGLDDRRGGKTRSVRLSDGDAVVWGGAARLAFHGVRKLPPGADPRLGAVRINLTFRRAG